jgi:alpha-L-rhamnosidase
MPLCISLNLFVTGETYDSRLETPGWNTASFDDSAWAAATVVSPPSSSVLISSHAVMEHIAVGEVYTPLQMWESSPGTYIFDFGQNMVR